MRGGVLLASTILLAIALGCSREPKPRTTPPRTEPVVVNPPKTAEPSSKVVEGTGTMVHVGVEGGFYAIKSEEGVVYDPKSLPSGFHNNGLRVRYKLRVIPDAVGIHQVGPIVEVLELQPLK